MPSSVLLAVHPELAVLLAFDGMFAIAGHALLARDPNGATPLQRSDFLAEALLQHFDATPSTIALFRQALHADDKPVAAISHPRVPTRQPGRDSRVAVRLGRRSLAARGPRGGI